MGQPATRARKLTRERVAEAALELLVREGRPGLSMRRLAAELDVGTMTLYGYFRTKDELLDAAVDLASESAPIPPRRGPWRGQLRALFTAIYGILRRYPVALELRSQRPLNSAGVLRWTEAGLEILQGAGLDRRGAAQAWRLLFTYTFGFAAFTPAELSAQDRREIRAELAALPPDELPRVVGALPEAIEAMAGPETFRSGLEVILDGLELAVSRSAERNI